MIRPPVVAQPSIIKHLRYTTTITAATQTVSYDAARRGNGLWHLRSGKETGEDGNHRR